MAVKTGTTGSMQVDTDLVRELAAMLNDTGLSEIEVADGERKIRVSRTMTRWRHLWRLRPLLHQAPLLSLPMP